MIDIDAIRRSNPLPEIAGKVVSLKAAGSEWVACCPFHADRSPSFTIYNAGKRFHCFGCGASGDVLDFVQRLHRVEFSEAVRMLDASAMPSPALLIASIVERSDRSAEVMAIWEHATPAAGTLAEVYLRYRGISPPYPNDIRFLHLPYGTQGAMPCLVAAVRNFANEVAGIQRIWLAHDGLGKADVPKPKLSLGAVKGGAIRLGEPGATGSLIVCEGPEDGLSLASMLEGPVWVAAGASMLPGMQFPPDVQSIVIAADNDPPGKAAAEKAAEVFAARGLAVRVIHPLAAFKDFNDELRGAN